MNGNEDRANIEDQDFELSEGDVVTRMVDGISSITFFKIVCLSIDKKYGAYDCPQNFGKKKSIVFIVEIISMNRIYGHCVSNQ